MQVYIRLYRTHDFDLMSLHYTGALDINKAMKKAIVSFYKGEHFYFEIAEVDVVSMDVLMMPLKKTFSLSITEQDAPGITNWIRGNKEGFRNCFFKGILRHYLKNAATSMFRTDHWLPAFHEEGIPIEKTERKRARTKKKELTGSEWIEAVAKEKIKTDSNVKVTDIEKLLFSDTDTGLSQENANEPMEENMDSALIEDTSLPEEIQDQNMETEEVMSDAFEGNHPYDSGDESEEDDDFDAFAEFQQLTGGTM